MGLSELQEKLASQQPRLIYLSGKTSTGKTTFARLLEQQGYTRIELDKIVMESVVIPFGVETPDGFLAAYRGEGPVEQTRVFIDAARQKIFEELQSSPVVVEGAVTKAEILRDIFTENLNDFVFLYFHPVNLEAYAERIKARLIAGVHNGSSGLPKHFWELVKKKDLKELKEKYSLNDGVKESIKKYAALSMKESEDRLGHLRSTFSNIRVITF